MSNEGGRIRLRYEIQVSKCMTDTCMCGVGNDKLILRSGRKCVKFIEGWPYDLFVSISGLVEFLELFLILYGHISYTKAIK